MNLQREAESKFKVLEKKCEKRLSVSMYVYAHVCAYNMIIIASKASLYVFMSIELYMCIYYANLCEGTWYSTRMRVHSVQK